MITNMHDRIISAHLRVIPMTMVHGGQEFRGERPCLLVRWIGISVSSVFLYRDEPVTALNEFCGLVDPEVEFASYVNDMKLGPGELGSIKSRCQIVEKTSVLDTLHAKPCYYLDEDQMATQATRGRDYAVKRHFNGTLWHSGDPADKNHRRMALAKSLAKMGVPVVDAGDKLHELQPMLGNGTNMIDLDHYFAPVR